MHALAPMEVDYLLDVNKKYLENGQCPSRDELDQNFVKEQITLEHLISTMMEPPKICYKALYIRSDGGEVAVSDAIRVLMRCQSLFEARTMALAIQK